MEAIAPLPDADSTLAPGQVLGARYRLVKLVDRGGMAEVWEAHDAVLTRAVAIKVLHARLAEDESFRLRFRREAIAAARLAHPNVVATYDTGADGDTAFIVMELVKGRSLREVIAEKGSLDPVAAVRVAVQVARALEHGHRAGLVHADVKAANILLCDDAFGNTQVKVSDFGIAKATVEGADDGEDPTSESEQRADVHALGAVLYEMLSGRPPLEEGEPPRLRRLRNRIPRQLDAVVMRALAAEPEERYGSATELRSALEGIDFGDDDAVPMVRRERTPPRGTPRVQPRPPQRSALTLLVLGLVLAAAVIVAALVLGRGPDGDTAGTGDQPGGKVRIVSASAFDPQGDGSENAREVAFAFDGQPSTAWHTERYHSRPFGGLRGKTGVGLVLRLDSVRALERLQVTSSTDDWAAQVYVAREAQRVLDAWGEPLDSKSNIDGASATFDLKGRRGGAVLLWITDTGTSNRAQVAELSVSAR